MEIKVRSIDSNIIDRIDLLAKLNGDSRDKFLRNKIEEIAFKNEINQLDDNYQMLIQNLIDAIKNHTRVLSTFMDEFLIHGEDVFNIDYKDISKNILEVETNLQYYAKDKSEIKVRDVPIDIVKRIDEISKQRNISRNEFLNLYLKQLVYCDKLKLVDEKYGYLVEKTLGILDFSNRILEVFIAENIISISPKDVERIN